MTNKNAHRVRGCSWDEPKDICFGVLDAARDKVGEVPDSFGDYYESGAKYITVQPRDYYPDYLAAAMLLYEDVMVRFRELIQTTRDGVSTANQRPIGTS